LHKAELDVTGYDVWKGSSEKFAAAGAKTASTAKEACEGAKVVVLMVVNAEQAEGVLFDGGVAEGEFDRRARGLAAGVDEIWPL
jgi:3-hydroxyisobutyrate dehydrogenase